MLATSLRTRLRAITTGHPGSMTTIHADTPGRAVEQLALLVLQAGIGLRRADVAEYAQATVDVIVQLVRVAGSTAGFAGDFKQRA